MADWNAIKTEYITTDTSYRKLAEKYGVSRVQVGSVGKRENWVELRRQHLDESLTKTLEVLSGKEAERAERLMTAADRLLLKIEDMVEELRPSFALAQTQSLRHLTGALKDLRDVLMVRSDGDRREQEARIRKLQRESEHEETGAQTVTVVFSDELEEYSK